MSGDICADNRFELIGKYQKILIDRTNITDSPDEMKALYSILYRFWQMGWLDRLDTIADMLAENAKLRKQLESIVGRSFRTADKMACLEDENDKLRELVEDMLDGIEIRAAWHRPPTDEMYEEFAQRARELGVEVDG